MQKFSSILDYAKPGLDPAVWGSDGNLLPKHKEAVLTRLDEDLKKAKFEHFAQWAKSIHVLGSLTTYQYISTTDFDVHIEVDLPKFLELEKPEMKEKEAEEFFDDTRKEFFEDTTFVLPGTKHFVEFYFVTPASAEDVSRGGVYDLLNDEWIKDSVAISADFDIEVSKPKFIEEAAKIAAEFDESLGDIKRQIMRIEELQETIEAWTSKKKKLFQEKLNQKLEHIETEIQELVDKKREIIENRRGENFDPESEQEIKFKYLQKFGYFFVVTQLKKLLEVAEDTIEVSEEDVPEIKDVILNPEPKVAAKTEEEIFSPENARKLYIDFDNTIVENDKENNLGKLLPGAKEALDKLKADGWEIVIYSGRANTPKGEDEIRDFMRESDLPYDEIFVGKPIGAYYIDDRNIVFTDWKDVLQNVGKPNEKKAQQEVKYDYSSTQFNLPKDITQKILEWSVENIPNEDLYDDETNRYGRELESHVTVLYGILTNDSSELEELLKGEKPVKIKFGETRHFNTKTGDAVNIEIESKDLEELHKKLSAIKHETLQDEYRPHVTIAYVKDGLGKKYSGKDILNSLEVKLDSLKFSPKEGDPKSIELNSTTKEADFLPSLVNAPDNHWTPDSNLELAVKPDPVSDEQTYFAPQADKPRKSFWQKLLDLIVRKDNKTVGKKAVKIGWGAWLSPDGKIYEAEEHRIFLEEHPEVFGLTKQQVTVSPEELYALMEDQMKKGWVRLRLMNMPYQRNVLYVQSGSRSALEKAENAVFDVLDNVDEIKIFTLDGIDKRISVEQFKETGLRADLKLSKLDKKASISGSAWVDPRGKVYEFPTTVTHTQWIRKNLTKLQSQYGIEEFSKDTMNILDKMLELGWVRVNGYRGSYEATEFSIQVADLMNPPDSLQSFLDQHYDWNAGDPILMDDSTGRHAEVDITGDVKDDIRRSIRKDRVAKLAKRFHPKSMPPKSTTWDSLEQDNEPFKPLPVTYSPETNDKNLGSRYPYRFMRRPVGPNYSDEGQMLDILEHPISKKEASWINTVMYLVNSTGGATYNTQKGNLAGTANYAVSIYPDRSMILPRSVTEKDLEEYAAKNSDLLNAPDNSLGVWHDTAGGKYYLDVVVTIPDIEQAKELGRKHNQIAIFDLKNFVEIPTGGTGEVKQSALDYKFWIAPSGEYYKVHGIHLDWVKQHWNDLGFDKFYNVPQEEAQHDDDIADQAYDHMIRDLGWARVTVDSGYQFLISVDDVTKLPSSIEPFVEQFFNPNENKAIWINDYNDRNVVIDDPIGNIQAKVMQELAHYVSHAASLCLSKKEAAAGMGIGYWISPQGKMFTLEEHLKLLKEKPEMFGLKPQQIPAVYSQGYAPLLNKGWVRVREYGQFLYLNAANLESAQKAEDIVYKLLPSLKALTVSFSDGESFSCKSKAFLQDGWDALSRDVPGATASMDKLLPREDLYNEAGSYSSTYTDEQGEEFYNEQHEMHDDQGGGNVYHDYNDDSRDYPKEPPHQKVFLDRLTTPPNGVIPSYEVTWYFGQPADDNGSM